MKKYSQVQKIRSYEIEFESYGNIDIVLPDDATDEQWTDEIFKAIREGRVRTVGVSLKKEKILREE